MTYSEQKQKMLQGKELKEALQNCSFGKIQSIGYNPIDNTIEFGLSGHDYLRFVKPENIKTASYEFNYTQYFRVGNYVAMSSREFTKTREADYIIILSDSMAKFDDNGDLIWGKF